MIHKHKLHELIMTITLSERSRLFCLTDMLANIHEYFNCCHYFYFFLRNLSKILHAAFLLPVSIFHKILTLCIREPPERVLLQTVKTQMK